MNILLEMQQNTVKLFNNKLKKFCEPLISCFDVNHFYHGQISNSGNYVNIGLAADWGECYFSHPYTHLWPTLCHPQNFYTDIIFLKTYESDITKSTLEIAKNHFHIHHVFELTYKTNEGNEFFGFGLKSPNPIHHIAFVKEIPLLRMFIKRYLEEFKSYLNKIRDYEVDIAGLIGNSFFQPINVDQNARRLQFYQQMGMGTLAHLSNREKDVAKCLIRGGTASQISKELFISIRTAEHHLEHLKDKLNCDTKSELIQKILDLDTIGYFSY